MNKTVFVEGILILIMGIYCIVEGFRLVAMEKAYLHDLFGPGRYIFGLGVVLIILGVIYVLYNIRRGIEGGKPAWEMSGKVVSMVGLMALYVLLIPIIGYLPASLTFFLTIHRVFGFRSWLINIFLSVGISISFYVVFIIFLHVALPKGMLFH